LLVDRPTGIHENVAKFASETFATISPGLHVDAYFAGGRLEFATDTGPLLRGERSDWC
jgi:hypothetical protein